MSQITTRDVLDMVDRGALLRVEGGPYEWTAVGRDMTYDWAKAIATVEFEGLIERTPSALLRLTRSGEKALDGGAA
jgi:hypothetical protein